MMFVIAFTLICLIAPSLAWMAYLVVRRMGSREAIGTIVDYESMGGEGGDSSAPIVEFELPDGRKITFTEKVHTSNDLVSDILTSLSRQFFQKLGPDKVKVYYEAGNPQNARIYAFGGMMIVPMIIFLIGSCLLLFAIPATRELVAPLINLVNKWTGGE